MTAKWRQVRNEIDLVVLVEEIDPDWRVRFMTAESAAEFYEDDEDFEEIVDEFLEEEDE